MINNAVGMYAHVVGTYQGKKSIFQVTNYVDTDSPKFRILGKEMSFAQWQDRWNLDEVSAVPWRVVNEGYA